VFDLRLSPEQLEIRDTVRDFAEREIRPQALAPARLEAFERPLLTGLLEAASRLGLRTLALPEDAGGAGADALTCAIVTEELAAGDPDIAAVLAHTAALARALSQRESLLSQFIRDDAFHLALADGEAKYSELEKRLAAAPVITVPTITMEGDANGAPHADASAYAKKFTGRYAHRVVTGGVGHNLPQEAPQAFAQAVVDITGR